MRALEFVRDHVTFKLPYDFSGLPHENPLGTAGPKFFFLISSNLVKINHRDLY